MMALVTVQPVLYALECRTASTVRSALVVVPRIASRKRPGAHRRAGAIAADRADESMLNRVPFRASCWIVAHRNLEPQAITHHDLEALLPESRPRAVTATRISQDQQLRNGRKR